jgi:hypothetical protein
MIPADCLVHNPLLVVVFIKIFLQCSYFSICPHTTQLFEILFHKHCTDICGIPFSENTSDNVITEGQVVANDEIVAMYSYPSS